MPRSTSAGFVQPMTARVVEELPEGEQWIYEVKFDGYRACDEAVDVGARQIVVVA